MQSFSLATFRSKITAEEKSKYTLFTFFIAIFYNFYTETLVTKTTRGERDSANQKYSLSYVMWDCVRFA